MDDAHTQGPAQGNMNLIRSGKARPCVFTMPSDVWDCAQHPILDARRPASVLDGQESPGQGDSIGPMGTDDPVLAAAGIVSHAAQDFSWATSGL